MANPLVKPAPQTDMTGRPVYGTQAWCDERNKLLAKQRTDCQWHPDGRGGAYLADIPEWTARHTDELARQAERDREEWKRAQEAPRYWRV